MILYKRVMCCIAFSMCCLSSTWAQAVNPYVLHVGEKPYLLRSFLMFDGNKRTHVISVGTPEKVNYAYDLKQGALLQLWRGQFMDVSEMWKDRGEPQLAKPMETVLSLSSAPAIALLTDKDEPWPDSIAFDHLVNKGYVLDKNKMPTFLYSSNGADVSDKIAIQNGGEAIARTISLSNSKEPLYCRVAVGANIEALPDNTYRIGDKAYTVKIPKEAKVFIRKTKNGQELLAPLQQGAASLTYFLIW